MAIISSETIIISSGMSLSGCLITHGGVLIIQEEGWGEDIGLADGGTALVSSGGILYICGVSSGGTATVLNSGYAQDVTIKESGLFQVSSGGTAHHCIVSSGGTQIVYAETTVASTTVLDGGVLRVSPDGHIPEVVISRGGTMVVQQQGIAEKTRLYGTAGIDGVAQYTEVLNGGRLDIQSNGWSLKTSVSSGGLLVFRDGAIGQLDTVCDGGIATISSGGMANLTTVYSGGWLAVSFGGTATEVLENGGYVEISDGATVMFASNTISGLELAGSATVHAGTTATDTTVNSGGKLEVFSGGAVNGVTVNPGGAAEVSSGVISGAVINADGSLLIYDGTRITGHMTFESGATVIPFVGSILDFDLTQTEAGAVALVNDLSVLMGTPSYTLTVAYAQGEGTYALADGAAEFSGTLTVQNTLGETLGTLTVGETFNVDGMDYTLNLTDSVLSIIVELPVMSPTNLVGTKDRVSWDPAGTDGFAVEYSKDGFAHCLGVKVSSNAADMLALPAGTYQWRVKATDGEAWAVGDEIVSDNDNTPKVLQSNADGSDDLFFAMPNGTWGSIYYAQHVGSINDWTGTNEIVSAKGKNRLADLFFCSDDANILCLTDDENGDGIFVDDEFTELPEGIIEQQARIAQIDELRTGAGDDIVDMTSQQFEYIGDGLTIRGGDGDDTIWANKGDNWLFGDAGNDRIVGASGNDVIAGGIGNDRMHGGGGSDLFTFCENWGTDTVEQLATGSVTLWFASGSMENWNAETLTYTEDSNSVKVSGIAADKITLKFGDDGSDQFTTLSSVGAFADFTSQKIFEKSGKGILASM